MVTLSCNGAVKVDFVIRQAVYLDHDVLDKALLKSDSLLEVAVEGRC